MGHLVDGLSIEVIELLKESYDTEIKKVEEFIINSGIFYNDIKNVHPDHRGCYRSKTYKDGKPNGITYISWYDNWSGFEILMDKKTENFKLFGYELLHFYPLYLREGKQYEHKEEGTFENFEKCKKLNQLILSNEEIMFIYSLNEKINEIVSEIKNRVLVSKEILEIKQLSILKDLDKDSNGEVDLVDGESFNKLLTKNQKCIIEIDKNYIQKFVKISIYLKTKKSNTQKIFDSIKDTKNDNELNELFNLLKNQIHTYELLVFHSISMVTSLVESDLITFYEIYECFDQLGVFNSNWENEVSNKLTDIGDGIKDLMYSIYQMENKIVNSIDNLTYLTQDSFEELNNSVNKQLSSIDSSIKFNNLLTGIQTYQMYKINQNTKRIN